MKTYMILATATVALLTSGSVSMVLADTFGTGANQFTLDFVPISGATNPTSGYGSVNYSYRMGTHEITNDQWDKFLESYGEVTGSEYGYSEGFYNFGTGTTTVPTNNVSWYEVAQFVNWLNTSTGHQAAYKFTGTQGSDDYPFVVWSETDNGYDANNPYRNKNAFYFLPNENEWVKAAYWNGTSLQTYATKSGESLTQGDGTGTGWNYYDGGFATDPIGPWTVGSGSQELNGTYDMMGNNWEWMESPWGDPNFGAGSSRGLRSGDWGSYSSDLQSSYRDFLHPANERSDVGFRVASVPGPFPDAAPGDTNNDGRVDDADAKTIAAHWGQTGGWAQGDFNGDGFINAADASILAANWGHVTEDSGATSVPEPATIALLSAGIIALLACPWQRGRRGR